MRKRIVIVASAALIVIGVGVLVSVLSQPKPGTVEWHKREYQRAAKRWTRARGPQVLGQSYYKFTGRQAPWFVDFVEELDRLSSNETALVKLGWLEERQLALRNPGNHVYNVLTEIEEALGGERAALKAFVMYRVRRDTTTALVVTAPHTMMPRVEKIVREAVVPR